MQRGDGALVVVRSWSKAAAA